MEAVAVKKSRPAKAAKAAKPVGAIICYKGTDANMRCNGYQYELGKTFTHTGTVAACSQGFHSCENPLDVWNYYGVAGGNRFFKVRASGKLDRHSGDSKVASAEVHFEAELKLPDFIKMAVKWVMDAAKDKGDRVQSSKVKNSKLAASGDSSQLAASGYSSKLAASGYSSKLAASGDSSKLAASGDSSKLAASGDYSKLAASGDSSKLAASGDSSQLAASGDYSKLAASGDSSKLAASGYSSKLEVTGKHSAAAAVAPGCAIKGIDGTPIAICEYDDGKPVGFVCGIIGQDGLKADTWYRAQGGKLVEA